MTVQDTVSADTDARVTDDQADARIAELLGDHPDEMGIDTSEQEDEDDTSSPQQASDEPAEQEDEPEEQEDEPDPDDWDAQASQEDDEQAQGDEPEGGRFVSDDGKVRLSNGQVVSIRQLKEGSLLQEDYSRKQMELTNQVQHTTALQAQLQAQYEQVAQQNEVAMQLLDALMPSEPDIALARQDPVEYSVKKAEFDRAQQTVAQLVQHQQQVQAQQDTNKQQMDAVALGNEVEQFLIAEPSLRDPKKWEALRQEMVTVFGREYGAKMEDFGGMSKAWVLRAFTDALRYRRMKAQKPKAQKKAEGKPKVRRPSKRQSSQEASLKRRDDLREALARTGRKDVADRLLEGMVS